MATFIDCVFWIAVERGWTEIQASSSDVAARSIVSVSLRKPVMAPRPYATQGVELLHNDLAAAWRNLRRNKLYANINIVGLAVGFAAALIGALYVRNELTYERFLASYERIYRISPADRAGHAVRAARAKPVRPSVMSKGRNGAYV
jgi:hypothetical protein